MCFRTEYFLSAVFSVPNKLPVYHEQARRADAPALI
jgi:hypothetical protein